jgi:hypothetical protein
MGKVTENRFKLLMQLYYELRINEKNRFDSTAILMLFNLNLG